MTHRSEHWTGHRGHAIAHHTAGAHRLPPVRAVLEQVCHQTIRFAKPATLVAAGGLLVGPVLHTPPAPPLDAPDRTPQHVADAAFVPTLMAWPEPDAKAYGGADWPLAYGSGGFGSARFDTQARIPDARAWPRNMYPPLPQPDGPGTGQTGAAPSGGAQEILAQALPEPAAILALATGVGAIFLNRRRVGKANPRQEPMPNQSGPNQSGPNQSGPH